MKDRPLFLEQEFEQKIVKLQRQKKVYQEAESLLLQRTEAFVDRWKGQKFVCNNPDARSFKYEKTYILEGYCPVYKPHVHVHGALCIDYLKDFRLVFRQYRTRSYVSAVNNACLYILKTSQQFDEELDELCRLFTRFDHKVVSPMLNTISYLKYLDEDISEAYLQIARAYACPVDVEKTGFSLDNLKRLEAEADTSVKARIERALEAVGYSYLWAEYHGVTRSDVILYLTTQYGPPQYWDEETYFLMELAGADRGLEKYLAGVKRSYLTSGQ